MAQLERRLNPTEPARRSLNYRETPNELVNVERLGSGKLGEVSIIFPSNAPDKEINQNAFGSFLAKWVKDKVTAAKTTNKTLVLDLPTGTTPRSMWQPLSESIINGELDLTGVVFMGHEIAFGDPEPDGPVDYEKYRRKVFKDSLGVDIQEITDPHQVESGEIQGNYISMNSDPSSAEESAKRYDEIIHALHDRKDVQFVGLYGVGTDGHVAEIQSNTLTGAADYDTQHGYSYPITWNSDVMGAVRVPGDADREFHNNMWKPGQEQSYKGGTDLIGPGWEDLLFHDEIVLAFNAQNKRFAFQSTIEGSVDAIVTEEATDGTQKTVMEMTKDHGKGEGIYDDLRNYAQNLEDVGFLQSGVVEAIDKSNELKKSKQLFRKIYSTLYEKEATVDDELYHDIFENMWNFANDYLGKQTPVSVLVRLRTLLGLNTTIVAVPEVVQGTKYETLAPIQN